jgi:serine/threonine-protein kinase
LTHRHPQILPGGKAVLFTASASAVLLDPMIVISEMERANIEVLSFNTSERKALVRGGYMGRYLPTRGSTGHLIYIQQGTLFGVAFDPARLEMLGAPTSLLEDVTAQIDFSRTGVFVYRSAGGKPLDQTWPVVWLHSSGKTEPLIGTPGFYNTPRFSPDGTRLAFSVSDGKSRDIYVYDLRRDTMSRVTFTGQAHSYPTWTPDGKHLAFNSSYGAEHGYSIWWIRADGAGEAQRLLQSKTLIVPYSFSPDGRRLAYYVLSPETRNDIWTIALDLSDPEHPKPGKPEPFLQTPYEELRPTFSPDGRWIAYASSQSGPAEVYVRPFPGPGGQWQISTGGGGNPIWSRNTRELFYTNPEHRIMVVAYTTEGGSFMPGKPRLWSSTQIRQPTIAAFLDLAPDGKRFAVFPVPADEVRQRNSSHVTFLLNFFDEVKRRIP